MVYRADSGGLSSVNHKYVSCHIIRGVRGQEDGRSFQIVFAAESSQGNSLEERFFVFFNDHRGHVRREPARCDGIDLNIVGAPLAGQVPGESDYASFTRVVTDGLKLRRRAAKAGHRGDIDDLAAALPHHEPSGSLRKQKGGGQIRFDHLVPMLELHLLNGSAPGRSRVVNEDVDFLKPGKRFLHNGTDLVRVSDVTSKRQRLNSESPQLLRCLLATLPLPRAKYQVRAHLCQALGHLAPEANRASRNNSHSSCKVKELLGIHSQPCHPRNTPPFFCCRARGRKSRPLSLGTSCSLPRFGRVWHSSIRSRFVPL